MQRALQSLGHHEGEGVAVGSIRLLDLGERLTAVHAQQREL